MTEQERIDLANVLSRALQMFETACWSYHNCKIEREQLKCRMARVLSRNFGSLPELLVVGLTRHQYRHRVIGLVPPRLEPPKHD